MDQFSWRSHTENSPEGSLMPCLCLHGDRPPDCTLLYRLTEVQLASPAIDFHTISLSPSVEEAKPVVKSSTANQAGADICRKLLCILVDAQIHFWTGIFSFSKVISHVLHAFFYSALMYSSHQIR